MDATQGPTTHGPSHNHDHRSASRRSLSISLALIIVVAAPVSGASLNPARSFGSAAIANVWQPLWLYLVAPVLGALLAGAIYKVAHRGGGLLCAKLHHHNRRPCIFRCGYREAGIDPLAK